MFKRAFHLVLMLVLLSGLAETGWGQVRSEIPIERMKVKMSHVPSMVYGALYVALEKGYFAQRGLDVEIVIVRGGDTSYQIAGGTLEFAGGSPDSAFFNGLKRGMPLLMVGSLAVNGPKDSNTPLVVRKGLFDSGQVTKVEHLKGRKVASLVPGGIVEYLLSQALKTGGLSIDNIQFIAPMGFPQMVDALTTGAIDAALLAEPFVTMAEGKGAAVRLSREHDLKEQILGIKVNSDFAKKNRAVVINYLIAYLKGARDLAGKGWYEPENLKILEKYTKLPPEIIKAAVPPVIPPNGEFNIESIMNQQRYHMSRGRLTYTELFPVDSFLDRSYLDEALKNLGEFKK